MKILMMTMMLALVSCASTKKDEAYSHSTLLNGQTANGEILVKNSKDQEIKISSVLSKKPTVLVFYRGGWCPYCNKQLASLRKITKQIGKLGYQLVAISPDKVSKFKESIAKYKLDYELLSDSELNLATSFGLSFRVDDETYKKYLGYGINLEEASGKIHHSLPMPAIYVLDRDGLVHFNYVNPNYKVRFNEKILLSVLKELKLK